MLTEDYSNYVMAWIFQNEEEGSYYVMTVNGDAYRYDMVNGTLMGLDD